jgi:hypothetical protein
LFGFNVEIVERSWKSEKAFLSLKKYFLKSQKRFKQNVLFVIKW